MLLKLISRETLLKSWTCYSYALSSRLSTTTNNKESPIIERVDRYCKWINSLTLPLDWNEVQQDFSKGRKGISPVSNKMPYSFEIRTINCLLKNLESSKDIRASLLQFVQDKNKIGTEATKTRDKKKRNPVFEIHVASLMSSVDPVKYSSFIRDTINSHKDNSFISQDVIFLNCLVNLAGASKSDCLFVADVVKEKELHYPENVALKCLDFGLFTTAMDLVQGYDHFPKWFADNITSWIDSLSQHECSNTELMRLLGLLSESSFPFPSKLEQKLRDVMKRYASYQLQPTVIDDKGICSKCGTQLKNFSQEEFNRCSQEALEKILRREDIFFNTTPEEIRSFMDFIKKMKSMKENLWFDCVIDGLNACHARHALVYDLDIKPTQKNRFVGSYISKEITNDNLMKVVSKCLELFNGRVLLFGRKHMMHMPTIQRLKKEDRVFFYFISNTSRDDPFMIYTALQSPKTYIVSNDMFRDHSCLVEKRHLFERWLKSRIIRIPKNIESFVVPPLYEVTTNVSDDGSVIHFPFTHSTVSSQDSVIDWVCCSRGRVKQPIVEDLKESYVFPALFNKRLPK